MRGTFEVWLWPRWRVFGETTLIPFYDCVSASSAFAAIEQVMRARRLWYVGHAVAECVDVDQFLIYRAYGVTVSLTAPVKRKERVQPRKLVAPATRGLWDTGRNGADEG